MQKSGKMPPLDYSPLRLGRLKVKLTLSLIGGIR